MKQQARMIRLLIFTFLTLEIIGHSFFRPPLAFSAPAAGTDPLAPAAHKAAPSPQEIHEIHVTLFGQPCLMRGPFEIPTLKAIHEISPEQIPPAPSLGNPEAIPQFKKTLGKLNSAARTPSAFDRYRERLIHRLESQIAFAEGLRNARKTHKSAPLLEAIKPHAQQKSSWKNLEALAKKLDDGRLAGTPEYTHIIEQLSEAYGEIVEADPEEEFHSASRRLGIKYACSYEENGGDDSSEAEEDDSAPREKQGETPRHSAH